MGKNLSVVKNTIFFCDGSSCQKAGSELVVREARVYLRNRGLWDTTHTIKTRCNGRCEDAPTCIVQNGNYWYKELTPQKIKEVLVSHTENNAPLPAYLLYKDKDESLSSENERPQVTPKDFVLKEDEELGSVYVAKGFNSDQYLYPLFTYLLEENIQGQLYFDDKKEYKLSELVSVEYKELYTMQIALNNGMEYNMTIGGVPKHEAQALVQSKISSTEYFIHTKSHQKGIRFKNKMGRFVAMILVDADQEQFWKYCLQIQLLGKQNPLKTNAIT